MAEFSDSEIREILKRHGEDIGPITPSTRKIYLKKIASLMRTNGIPNNKQSKPLRKSEPVINKNSDRIYSSKVGDINSSNPIGNKINNLPSETNGLTQNRANYKNSFESPNLNTKLPTYNKNPEPIYNKAIDRTPSRNFSVNSSLDSDFQKIAEDAQRRELRFQNISPVNYMNTNERKYYRWNSSRPLSPTNVSSFPYSNESQNNENNNTKKWYNGSLNTITNYFGKSRNPEDLMDISDGDLSDNESGVINRLRRNYFKKPKHNQNTHVDHEPVGVSDKQCNENGTSVLTFLSASQLPNLLVLGFVAFAILMIGSYVLMRAQHSSHRLLDQTIDRLVCQPDSLGFVPPGSSSRNHYCFQEANMPLLRTHLSNLYEVLSRHSGDVKCRLGSAADHRVPFTRARDLLNTRLRAASLSDISQSQWSELIQLMLLLPRDDLQLAGYDSENRLVSENGLPEHVTYLEGLNPRLSLICRMKLGVLMMLSWVWYAVCVVAALTLITVFAYAVNLLRLRHQQNYERHVSEMREIVTSVSTLLQDQLRQSEISPSTEPFMALGKIRAIFQQTYPKLHDAAFWNQVKRFMYESEPLIELKETLVHGEIVQWKGRPGWQGSAVLSECQVKFDRGPTECLKIRNMDVPKFDESSHGYLRREVMTRIQDPSDVRDIRFLMKGSTVIVYVMCASREAAGKAFRKINANYFNGNLLNVKFIRLDKYLERFPDSRVYVK